MKPTIQQMAFGITLMVVFSIVAHGQLTIPNATGDDGVLDLSFPNQTLEIDLSLSPTGSWLDASATPGDPEIGTYDETQWAVVFKYESVTIGIGSSVTFKNHPSGAPVVWLVSGDVTISTDGLLDLNGKNATDGPQVNSMGGPGGFPGGREDAATLIQGAGFGPGGGHTNGTDGAYREASDSSFAITYGNSRIVPLIGGSGSGGFTQNGGGGGGAILIACSNTVTVNGEIRANGGAGLGRDGSGGGIRIVTDVLTGTGNIFANAFPTASPGRIRLETNSPTSSLLVLPETILVRPGSEALIFPVDDPTATIVSIGGVSAPMFTNYLKPFTDTFVDQAPDVQIDSTGETFVVVETTGIDPVDTNTYIELQMRPVRGGPTKFTNPTVDPASTTESATWTFTGVNIPEGNVVFQVIARSM